MKTEEVKLSKLENAKVIMFKKMMMGTLKRNLGSELKQKFGEKVGNLIKIFYHLTYEKNKAFQFVTLENHSGKLDMTAEDVKKMSKMIPFKLDENEIQHCDIELIFNVKGYKINIQTKYKGNEVIKILSL
jgi:hypothetical protein